MLVSTPVRSDSSRCLMLKCLEVSFWFLQFQDKNKSKVCDVLIIKPLGLKMPFNLKVVELFRMQVRKEDPTNNWREKMLQIREKRNFMKQVTANILKS